MADSEESEFKPRRPKRATLRYSKAEFNPEDLLHFIELPAFTKRWEKLGFDDEDDLLALQLMIMADPKQAGDVIEGTDGLRKLRFARANTGKSGGVRVLYVHFEEFGIVLLCLVYGKNEQSNISADVKKQLNRLIGEQKKQLHRRFHDK